MNAQTEQTLNKQTGNSFVAPSAPSQPQPEPVPEPEPATNSSSLGASAAGGDDEFDRKDDSAPAATTNGTAGSGGAAPAPAVNWAEQAATLMPGGDAPKPSPSDSTTPANSLPASHLPSIALPTTTTSTTTTTVAPDAAPAPTADAASSRGSAGPKSSLVSAIGSTPATANGSSDSDGFSSILAPPPAGADTASSAPAASGEPAKPKSGYRLPLNSLLSSSVSQPKPNPSATSGERHSTPPTTTSAPPSDNPLAAAMFESVQHYETKGETSAGSGGSGSGGSGGSTSKRPAADDDEFGLDRAVQKLQASSVSVESTSGTAIPPPAVGSTGHNVRSVVIDKLALEEEEFDRANKQKELKSLASKHTTATTSASNPRALDFDEFADVNELIDNANAGASVSGLVVRKKLQPSKAQISATTATAAPTPAAATTATPAGATTTTAGATATPAPAPAPTGPGLQNALFAKLNLPPSHALDKYLNQPTKPTHNSEPVLAPEPAAIVKIGLDPNAKPAATATTTPAPVATATPQTATSSPPAAGADAKSQTKQAETKQPAAQRPAASTAAGTASAGAGDFAPVVASAPPKLDDPDAWDNVTKLREQQLKAEAQTKTDDAKSVGVIKVKVTGIDSVISYDEAVAYLTTKVDLSAYKKKIVRFDFRRLGFFAAAQYKLLGNPSLGKQELEDERDAMFCMALMQLDYKTLEPERMVQSIYRELTGDKLSCPRTGAHWDVIGFQGVDPATDLRGAGLFGLVQWLYMLKTYKPLMLRILRLSKDELQNFPLAVVSFNFTGLALQAVREGKLYSVMRKRGAVLPVVHELYMSLMYTFYLTWKKKRYTIMNFGPLKEYVDIMCTCLFCVDFDFDVCCVVSVVLSSQLGLQACKEPKKLIAFFVANADVKESEEQLEFTQLP